MADISGLFKKKVAGLPAWAWVGIIVAGVGVGLYIRNRTAEPAVEDATGLDEEGTVDDSYADIVPYDELSSEDYGYYPMTGGGPPSVYGGGAVRLNPGTLRIKIQYPKKKHHKKGGGKGGGKKRGRDSGALTGTRTREQLRAMAQQQGLL